MDDENNSISEISFEKSEIVRNSMIPLIDDAATEFKNIFSEAKKKTIFANNVLRNRGRADDYKIQALFNIDLNNWNDYSPETMREMVQSFADQVNAAKQEAAQSAEKVINLQSRLSSNEIANKRLTSCVDELETRAMNLLEKLNKVESVRIAVTRELKEVNEKINREKKNLGKELAVAKKDIHELQIEKHRSETQSRQLESNNAVLENRAKHAETEASRLRTELDGAVKTSNDTKSALTKSENLVAELTSQLENVRLENQIKFERAVRESKQTIKEKENALAKQIHANKDEIARIHSGYSKEMEAHKKSAKDAIARLNNDVEYLDASRMKYYKLYKDLLENLNDHKRKISQDVLKQTIHKLASEFRNDQQKTSQIRQHLQTVELNPVQKVGNGMMDALDSFNSASDRSHENFPPPLVRKPSGRNDTRNYDVEGRFGPPRKR